LADAVTRTRRIVAGVGLRRPLPHSELFQQCPSASGEACRARAGAGGAGKDWARAGAGSWERWQLGAGRPGMNNWDESTNGNRNHGRAGSVLAVETGRIYSGLKQAARNLRKRKAIAGQGDDRGKDQKPKRQEPRRVRDLCCSGLWPDASSPKTPKPQAEGRRLRRAWCGRAGVRACGCVVRGRGRILCVSCADRGLAAPRKGGTLSPTCHP